MKLACIFCLSDHPSLQALKDHSAACPVHPLAKENARLKEANALLHQIADRAYAVWQDATPLEETFNPYAYMVETGEIDELQKVYEVNGEKLVALGISLEDEAHDVLADYRKYGASLEEEIERLRALLDVRNTPAAPPA